LLVVHLGLEGGGAERKVSGFDFFAIGVRLPGSGRRLSAR